MNATDRLGLELRHLVGLRRWPQHASFGAAARDLGYPQPAISQQIAALERIVGLRLLERGPGPAGIRPTQAGRPTLARAQEILAGVGVFGAAGS